ncbi:3-oxoacyl-[acyl-carrier protein] reductase [Acidisarcina polymorpha]|uniref:3-oxoacyl-[acyl-carrier protein] reductase n=1 Tax=Acidisarcina polymorpha TaxID=2211140 RepID=A0A2Z5G193_9BACT|nr:glucose 1-dehydrogenase [Acidisarcina polymorpha]AXC12497.1 3-oxoacyl-[acyl-carrier protein] reductase [Acidisarcina polymorpha]
MVENLFDLSGSLAVVVGGTSGIGHAIALGLARAGADVVATSRRPDEVERTAAEITALNRRTLVKPADVRDRNSLQTLHDDVRTSLGQINILVNCAGITQRVPTLECAEEDWSRIVETNLTGTLRACQIFGQSMVAQRNGRIINIASLGTFVAFYEVAAYCASKAAVGSLTKSLAVELAPHGVCVNAIAPGIVPTAMNGDLLHRTARGNELQMRTPMKRFAHPDELIGAAIFLASEAASYVTGHILAVDGGYLASGVNQ